jgi:hypothetical protein
LRSRRACSARCTPHPVSLRAGLQHRLLSRPPPVSDTSCREGLRGPELGSGSAVFSLPGLLVALRLGCFLGLPLGWPLSLLPLLLLLPLLQLSPCLGLHRGPNVSRIVPEKMRLSPALTVPARASSRPKIISTCRARGAARFCPFDSSYCLISAIERLRSYLPTCSRGP